MGNRLFSEEVLFFFLGGGSEIIEFIGIIQNTSKNEFGLVFASLI